MEHVRVELVLPTGVSKPDVWRLLEDEGIQVEWDPDPSPPTGAEGRAIPVPPDIILWELGAYAGAKVLDAVWDKLKERWPDIKVRIITRVKDDN